LKETQTWTQQYKPQYKKELIGNKEAIDKIEKWVKSWKKKPPRKRALFIHGPPGTGKTVAIQLIAKENGYDLHEINASDTRTKKLLEETIGRAQKQTITIFGRKRMILFDEMEGISGQKDRGGIQSINSIIKNTHTPIILISTTIKENMENKLRSIVKLANIIEFEPIPFSQIYNKLNSILHEKGIAVEDNVIENICIRSQGDLRSAINDLETIARGKTIIRNTDLDWMGERDKQEYTPTILNKIFTARSLWEARHTISQSMIPYDDLFDWIYENVPLIIDEPKERLQALESLAKADIFSKRARTKNYRLLKYMFNDMTGGVSLHKEKSKGLGQKNQVIKTISKNGFHLNNFSMTESKERIRIKPKRWLGKEKWGILNKDIRAFGAKWIYGQNFWLLPYYREPQIKWRYIKTYHYRRRRKILAEKLAEKTHTSQKDVIHEILPLLKIIYQSKPESQKIINKWLELEDKEQEILLT
jgi:replication factor C large subunit